MCRTHFTNRCGDLPTDNRMNCVHSVPQRRTAEGRAAVAVHVSSIAATSGLESVGVPSMTRQGHWALTCRCLAGRLDLGHCRARVSIDPEWSTLT
jgi:hypothetical protein